MKYFRRSVRIGAVAVLRPQLREEKQNVSSDLRSATQGFLGDGLGYDCHRFASEAPEP